MDANLCIISLPLLRKLVAQAVYNQGGGTALGERVADDLLVYLHNKERQEHEIAEYDRVASMTPMDRT